MPEFKPVFKLSTLNGTNGFRLDGAAASDFSGRSVASAGDVNGDGFADLIIGAEFADPNGNDSSGASYVVFGKATGFSPSLLLSSLNGTNGFRLEGVAASYYTGLAGASAGDVNGDGFADLIIGATGASPNGLSSGSTYVVFGTASPFTSNFALSTLNGTNGFRLDGEATKDYSGISVASAGDVNGDGIADLIIGANGDTTSTGFAYVVFGSDSNFPSTFDLSSLNGTNGFRLAGVDANDFTGKFVASAGDVNGDGFSDVIVGSPYADPNGNSSGSSYVVFGKASGFSASVDLSLLDGTDGFRLDGAAAGDMSGWSVASAGDVNGDGFADMIIGDQNINPIGTTYVVFGRSAFADVVSLSSLNGTNGFRLDGLRTGDFTGSSVSSAGDVNGDGFADLLISCPEFDIPGASNVGGAYVVFGKASGFAAAIDLGALNGNDGFRIEGVAPSPYAGLSVASAGDVNGDGFADLIVGGDHADNGGTDTGSSYVVFGHRAMSSVVRLGTENDDRINGGVGDDLIKGHDGSDTLLGWEGDDTVWGGAGNDKVIIAAGDDELHGGSGRDTLSFEKFSDPITVNLAAGSFTLPDGDVQTFLSFENVRGGSGRDSVAGDARANDLNGAGGKDTIDAGAGDDALTGGAGADRLNGEAGHDHFVYLALTDSGITAPTRDTIVTFSDGEDVIDVLAIDARAGGGANAGDQAFTFDNTFGKGDIRATQSGADTLIEFNIDNDAAAEMSILLTNFTATNITIADFIA